MTTYFTAGHGNRPIEEFIGLLREAGIGCMADVRAYPASRRHPQFARAALERSLPEARIRYVWEGAALGGRRKPAKTSPNTGLRHPAFRAYADHMMTPEFHDGMARVLELGRDVPVALVCAERLPWQCHRFLISDFLVARGETVIHLVNPGRQQPHRLNPVARVRDGMLFYDGATQQDLTL